MRKDINIITLCLEENKYLSIKKNAFVSNQARSCLVASDESRGITMEKSIYGQPKISLNHLVVCSI